ncbi:LysR substrate-binding domain-containing protein [Novosphingobium mangrovi (ex Huang et al. 2023)]|uniref:LysR substrate-binding domain-containing protein n=1 Tax=Novosphingobium mangrovi (ex Huang et al. 2023) TaxID=2976432 RepID=A0ABT2I998_9SPHN|nr:LysR substrate-binding domain-containing protein [Novosphingobium mangrovi (ex Huang et al. 2023)]MCT2401396.1 LysR substrate-binding domain-containing protein [Novosphingobium mangrovi (ex Huang et al. 2023)]
MIGIRQLRYFVAVVRHGSFRAAAQAVHISQPPLTRQIQQLEEEVGAELLVRRNRGVEPTPAGAAFFEDASHILELLDRATERARRIGIGQLGRLDVGVFGSAVLDTVPRIMKAFRNLYPDVDLVLHNMDRETQLRALRDRRIAIGLNRFFDDEPGLLSEPLYTERLLAVVPSSHRLAAQKTVHFSDLANEPLIFYPRVSRPTGFTYELTRLFHDRRLTPNVVQNVDDVFTAVALVSSGIGVSFVVESARNLQLPGIAYVPIDPAENVYFDLSMIWREDDTTPLVAAFLEVARTSDKRISPEHAAA